MTEALQVARAAPPVRRRSYMQRDRVLAIALVTPSILATAVFVYPKEGMNLWSDYFVVPKGAPNVESAKTFMNWMMDPKNAAEASNFNGYNNAIKGSAAFMDPALAASPAINPPEALKSRFRPGKDCSVKARDLRDGVWTRLNR